MTTLKRNQLFTTLTKPLLPQGSCNITSGSVCGANGRTYSSRCAAQNDYIVVDYQGKFSIMTNLKNMDFIYFLLGCCSLLVVTPYISLRSLYSSH